MLKTMTIYVNRCKENNSELEEKCTNDKAKENSLFVGYEITIDGEFNTETGEFFAHKLNGVNLIKPVEI